MFVKMYMQLEVFFRKIHFVTYDFHFRRLLSIHQKARVLQNDLLHNKCIHIIFLVRKRLGIH
jgi:hypothetical protein